MLNAPTPVGQRGLTLVELMVTLSILAFLMLAGMPSLSQWMRNTQIRTVAEALQTGLAKARNEALRRNNRVMFSLVSNANSSTCALSSTQAAWIVSLQSPESSCNQAASETTAPMILDRWSPSDGTSNVTVQVKNAGCTANAAFTQVTFDGFGRVLQSAMASQVRCIVINHSSGSANRTLRLDISPAGNVRMCDPAITDTNDPRRC
jgi:type IV fimbrial biogenesis protein FimT